MNPLGVKMDDSFNLDGYKSVTFAPGKISMNWLYTFIFILFVTGCAATQKPQYTWSKAGGDDATFIRDETACKSRGYEVAGPLPKYQQVPDCKPSFQCGYDKASITASNKESRKVWESAFNSSFEACMHDKGYISAPAR